MSRKPTRSGSDARPAPPVDEALSALFRRSVRAVVALLVRLVAVGLLTALLDTQLPALRRNRPLVDAVAGMLVLYPFFTALGRNAAWRIALGRAYVREERWAEAERTLHPFRLRTHQVFDAAGEGLYWLARAQSGLGRADEAARLYGLVARHGRGEWQARAAAEIAAKRAVS